MYISSLAEISYAAHFTAKMAQSNLEFLKVLIPHTLKQLTVKMSNVEL